jgi:hypothetical protein
MISIYGPRSYEFDIQECQFWLLGANFGRTGLFPALQLYGKRVLDIGEMVH